MTDTGPATEEPEPFGSVLTLTDTQAAALVADDAFRDLPDGVRIGVLAEVETDDGTVYYQCAHPALDVELITEVVEDPDALAEVRALHAGGKPDWAEQARQAAKARLEARTPAQRKARRDAQRDRRAVAAGEKRPAKKTAKKR